LEEVKEERRKMADQFAALQARLAVARDRARPPAAPALSPAGGPDLAEGDVGAGGGELETMVPAYNFVECSRFYSVASTLAPSLALKVRPRSKGEFDDFFKQRFLPEAGITLAMQGGAYPHLANLLNLSTPRPNITADEVGTLIRIRGNADLDPDYRALLEKGVAPHTWTVDGGGKLTKEGMRNTVDALKEVKKRAEEQEADDEARGGLTLNMNEATDIIRPVDALAKCAVGKPWEDAFKPRGGCGRAPKWSIPQAAKIINLLDVPAPSKSSVKDNRFCLLAAVLSKICGGDVAPEAAGKAIKGGKGGQPMFVVWGKLVELDITKESVRQYMEKAIRGAPTYKP
jgi:hypothetical protein